MLIKLASRQPVIRLCCGMKESLTKPFFFVNLVFKILQKVALALTILLKGLDGAKSTFECVVLPYFSSVSSQGRFTDNGLRWNA